MLAVVTIIIAAVAATDIIRLPLSKGWVVDVGCSMVVMIPVAWSSVDNMGASFALDQPRRCKRT